MGAETCVTTSAVRPLLYKLLHNHQSASSADSRLKKEVKMQFTRIYKCAMHHLPHLMTLLSDVLGADAAQRDAVPVGAAEMAHREVTTYIAQIVACRIVERELSEISTHY